MKIIGIMQGSVEQAQPLVIGYDTVYVHTDIREIAEDINGEKVEGLYEYHEIQYDKDEYFKLISEKTDEMEILSAKVKELELENTQLSSLVTTMALM